MFSDKITIKTMPNILSPSHLHKSIYTPPDRLFVIGAIAVNAKFRDSHAYQGLIGMFISWIAGFVFLYAIVAYGLLTAIVIHSIYDLIFDAIRYGFRKLNYPRLEAEGLS